MEIVAQVHGALRCVDILEVEILRFVLVPAHRAITTGFFIDRFSVELRGEKVSSEYIDFVAVNTIRICVCFGWYSCLWHVHKIRSNQSKNQKSKSKNKLIGNRKRLITLVEPVQAGRWGRRRRWGGPGRRASGAERSWKSLSMSQYHYLKVSQKSEVELSSFISLNRSFPVNQLRHNYDSVSFIGWSSYKDIIRYMTLEAF